RLARRPRLAGESGAQPAGPALLRWRLRAGVPRDGPASARAGPAPRSSLFRAVGALLHADRRGRGDLGADRRLGRLVALLDEARRDRADAAGLRALGPTLRAAASPSR